MNSSTSSSNDLSDSNSETGLKRYRFLAATGAVAVMCLVANYVLASAIGGPKVAENNSQVVILRAQQYEFGPVPDGVLAGSSISGRLNPEDFAAGGFGVANLGLDGLSAEFALDIILDQEVLPSLVLVEVNTLDKPVGSNAATINEVRQGFGYDLANSIPVMRTEIRPTTVLYDRVRDKVNGGFGAPATSEVPILETQEEPGAAADNRDEVLNIEASIRKLQAKGVEVVLVVLPTGDDEAETKQLGLEVSSRTQAPLIDASGIGDDPSLYTDGVHLTPPAAQEVASQLGAYLSSRQVSS